VARCGGCGLGREARGDAGGDAYHLRHALCQVRPGQRVVLCWTEIIENSGSHARGADTAWVRTRSLPPTIVPACRRTNERSPSPPVAP
jgi:hypothetical protein